MKRIWDQPGFAGFPGTVDINGGRYDTNQIGLPVYEADGTTIYIPANDHRFIVDRAGIAFSLNGVNIGAFAPIAADRDARAHLNLHNQFSASGCSFPTIDPVDRASENGGGVFSAGGTYIHGCRGFDNRSTLGGNYAPVPTRNGCANPDGVVVISGSATVASVVLAKPELGQNGLGTGPRYLVYLTPVGATEPPTAGSLRARVANITQSGFDVVLEAAPGAGKSVTFAYQLKLNPAGLVS
jgi:hypothetical protein